MKGFLEIDKNGRIKSFDGDLVLPVKNKKVKRISKVVPENIFLRIVFIIIRSIVPDISPVANWTRKWNCKWIVVIGNRTYGPFKDRKTAIKFERKLYIKKEVLKNDKKRISYY